MIDELLQSYVRATPPEEEEPSRLYQTSPKKDEKKEVKKKKKEKSDEERSERRSSVNTGGRRKPAIVIEQRKVNMVALALDECYCDKDRAAAVSFGVMDIKYELKNKQSDKVAVKVISEDTDAMAFLMLGMIEIKNHKMENGVKFLTKVSSKLQFLTNFKHFCVFLGHRDVAR